VAAQPRSFDRCDRYLSQMRRELGRKSLLAFGRVYLREHFRLEPSTMHEEMAKTLQSVTERSHGSRIAWAAPRSHAKSTLVTLAYVLWCICYRREPFIVICSNSEERANDMLSQIKDELENNQIIRTDFPNICPVVRGRKMGPYRQNLITVGRLNPIRIASLGPQKAARGIRHRQHRPSLIILDDLESQESAGSEEQRVKLKSWFTKTVLKLGDKRTNVVLLGTIIHYDSLLADYVLRGHPGWRARCYKAVVSWSDRADLWREWEEIFKGNTSFAGKEHDEGARAFFESNCSEMLRGAEVLWPESEDYYELMVQRLVDGTLSFDSEKQNDPIDPAHCLFKPENFVFWNTRFRTLEELRAASSPNSFFIGACDPALGKSKRGNDDTAIITLFVDPTKGSYVVEADMRKLTPTETVDAIIEKHRRWRYALFGLETNHFQSMLADLLRTNSARAGLDVPVHQIQNTCAKEDRIRMLEPSITDGTIELDSRHTALINQLRQFPKAAHDDGPDALNMACQTVVAHIQRGERTIRWVRLWDHRDRDEGNWRPLNW